MGREGVVGVSGGDEGGGRHARGPDLVVVVVLEAQVVDGVVGELVLVLHDALVLEVELGVVCVVVDGVAALRRVVVDDGDLRRLALQLSVFEDGPFVEGEAPGAVCEGGRRRRRRHRAVCAGLVGRRVVCRCGVQQGRSRRQRLGGGVRAVVGGRSRLRRAGRPTAVSCCQYSAGMRDHAVAAGGSIQHGGRGSRRVRPASGALCVVLCALHPSPPTTTTDKQSTPAVCRASAEH